MEEIKLIKDIKDIVTKQDADTLSNKLMNAKVELNRTRNFLSDASNFCTDDYDMGLSCKMILRKHLKHHCLLTVEQLMSHMRLFMI